MRYVIEATFIHDSDKTAADVRALVYDQLDDVSAIDRITKLYVEQDEPTDAQLDRMNDTLGEGSSERSEQSASIQQGFKQ